ncbi:MAG: hypothetical protein ACTTID_02220 [Bacillales bacterium]
MKKINRLEKFSVREIVFLAICAASMLITSAIMPLFAHVPLFGIIQLSVSLQVSFFLTLALFNIKKNGSLLIIVLFSSMVQVFIAPIMFFISISSALIIELFALCFKDGFKNKLVRYISTFLYILLQMPLVYIFYKLLNKGLPIYFKDINYLYASLIFIGIILLHIIGILLGELVSKELKKAGVIKFKN